MENMNQADFMNKNIEMFETDLDDEDLYQAVDTIMSMAAANIEVPTASSDTSTSRFVSHRPIEEFLQEQQNINTKRKTTNDVKLFQSYLISINESRLPEFIPPCDLSDYISGFLLSVRRKDGGEFEPTTLRSFLSSINRHLISNSYKFSIMTDIQFRRCRDILAAKQKQLKSLGKGNKPMAADEVTDEELNIMYEKQVLGPETPASLIYTMWLICTLHFGMRTGKETHDLRWGDIQLQSDDDGTEYLIYTQERQTKTRTGSNPRDVRKTKPRAYAVPETPNRDPVALYKKFKCMRPTAMLEPDSPFFLSLNYSPKSGHPRYQKIPMGINKLYQVMNDLKAGAGLEKTQKRLTPYSVRKHLIQKLTDEGLPPNQIVQVSGHKNVNSLNNYSHLKADQTKNISSILSNRPVHPVKTPATHTVSTVTETCSSRPTMNNALGLMLPNEPVPTPKDPESVFPVNVYHNPRAYTPSDLGGMLTGNTIHGNVNINFNQSQQLSTNTAKFTNTSCVSPRLPSQSTSPVRPKYKRIRYIDSDSD